MKKLLLLILTATCGCATNVHVRTKPDTIQDGIVLKGGSDKIVTRVFLSKVMAEKLSASTVETTNSYRHSVGIVKGSSAGDVETINALGDIGAKIIAAAIETAIKGGVK